MDWMKRILRPKLFDFRSMAEYAEWLNQHYEDIPEPGEVWVFKTHAEQFCWIKVGDGERKYCDLVALRAGDGA